MIGHVWVIGPDGEHVGWLKIEDAEEMATRQDCDILRGTKIWSLMRRKS